MSNLTTIYIPKTICFRVTRKCNTKCPFCQAPPDKTSDMTLGQIEKCMKMFAEAGMESVKFTGGEPFVRKDFLEIVENCRKEGMLPVVCTNGLNISDEAVKVLKNNNAKVKVSLHGMPLYHNAFTESSNGEKILYNIKKMINAGVFVSIHTILHKDNINCVNELLDFCLENKIQKVSFIGLVERGRQKENGSKNLSIEFIRELIDKKRREYPQLDLRVLDFSKPYYVVEPDLKLCIERDNEQDDFILSGDLLAGDINLLCKK